MPFDKKSIFFLSLVLFLSFFATHDCFAETVEWKDFTKPLNLGKYKLTANNPLTINVNIPAEVLNSFKKIPLTLRGNFESAWPSSSSVHLRINDNIWAYYEFGDYRSIYTINIKTKHLKRGLTKLSFTTNKWSSYKLTEIHSLQFNIKKADKNRNNKIQTQPIPETTKFPTVTIAEKDKFKIAVMEFKSLNPGTKNTSLGSMIAEMFTTEVVNNNSFKIVEREQLNKVLGELQIGQSGVLDTTNAQKLGKILGAGAIIAGSVMK
ncbi:MAG: CsgG/HfaB family protein, partial [Desulfobacterales bacterium]|nr:CsgG/HfaB family protein [Desulfobacterales bacterium]MDX2509900.1 CsgG/HfaB family protein [Desulfobacterales bacterium]